MTKYWVIIKLVYSTVLRPLVEEKVKSTDAQWDDYLLTALDRIFGYDGK
jgi:hypothetical protein